MKALVKAWEQQEDSSQEPSINAVIAVMQVQMEQLRLCLSELAVMPKD